MGVGCLYVIVWASAMIALGVGASLLLKALGAFDVCGVWDLTALLLLLGAPVAFWVGWRSHVRAQWADVEPTSDETEDR